jgi:LPS-assembly lipoprotein
MHLLLLNSKNKIIFITLLLLSIVLQGCGFHLRGKKPIPVNLHKIYIDSKQPYSTLTQLLEQVLRSQGVIIVNNPDDAPIILRLFDQNFKSITLSQGASATTKEYTLTFTVSFELRNQTGNVIFGPHKIVTTRNILILENEVLSSSNETAVLKQAMQRDAMYQILNQLSSEEISEIANTTEYSSHEN